VMGMRLAMALDLRRCIGCGTCVIACKVNNLLPKGVRNIRLLDWEEGQYPFVKRRVLLVQCMHCENPPCVTVCPTGASYIDKGGVVRVDPNKCTGCKSCIMACPYGARTLLEKIEPYYGEPTPYDKLIEAKWTLNTIIKCDFCHDKIMPAIDKGMKPGVDPEATPYCVLSCPTNARIFGDLDDEESPIVQALRGRRYMVLREELGTQPKFFYLL